MHVFIICEVSMVFVKSIDNLLLFVLATFLSCCIPSIFLASFLAFSFFNLYFSSLQDVYAFQPFKSHFTVDVKLLYCAMCISLSTT